MNVETIFDIAHWRREAIKAFGVIRRYRHLVGNGHMKPDHDFLGEISLNYHHARRKHWEAVMERRTGDVRSQV